MTGAPLPSLILYARAGCGLCDEARETLESLLAERRAAGRPAPALVERDIDADASLRAAFRETIPVVELGDLRLELAVSPARLRRLLERLDAGPPG